MVETARLGHHTALSALGHAPPTHLLVDQQEALEHAPHHHAWREVNAGAQEQDVFPGQVPVCPMQEVA
jgi:hypothetical protein